MTGPPPGFKTDVVRTRRIVFRVLMTAGIGTIALAIALGIAFDPLLYVIALAGVGDLVFAWMIASGRIKPRPSDPAAAEAAEADPSYNPYARED
jgi:hypothetical protein